MNIVQLLDERERCNTNLQLALECAMEDSFIAGYADQFDNAMPRTVSSTIAIAMACDGKTFATTHGDHTVKVFEFASGQQIRNFSGHPRTPWTLKYHPTNPNIVASGCLGFQVRVWDIEENACLNLIVFTQTIISLAFHPAGQYIAVASGMRIEMWEWQVPDSLLQYLHETPQQPHDTRYATNSKHMHYGRVDEGPHCRGISHKRNVRAVVFHPSGQYLFAVAPDTPKLNSEDLAHCRLYACEFQALFELDRVPRWGECLPGVTPISHATDLSKASTSTASGGLPGPLGVGTATRDGSGVMPPTYEEDRDNGEGGTVPADDNTFVLPLKLSSCRVLLPQVHLYSDGGIDVSQDGRYLLTCARVHIPPFYYEWQAGVPLKSTLYTSTSPNSHPARVVSDERELLNASRPKGILRNALRPDGSEVGGSKMLAGAGTVNAVQPLPQAPPPPPPLFTPLNRRQQAAKGADSDSRPISGVHPSSSAAGSGANSNRVSPAPSGAAQGPGVSASPSSEHLSSLLAGLALPPPAQGTRTDGAPAVIDMTRRRLGGIPPRPPMLDPSAEDMSEGWPEEQLKGETSFAMEGAHAELSRMSQRRIVPQQRHKLIRMGDRPPLGWSVEDHLCLFEINFQGNGTILAPSLVNSKCLPGSLTKAVTSTKLSPTGRYALVGYGVRIGGQVEGHPRKHAACEVVRINDQDMASVTVMSDFEDEVNIAQFHPFAGRGIVYGTKRGKVRTFCKS